jgi:hypothetical protein
MGSLRDRRWRFEDVTDALVVLMADDLATFIRLRPPRLANGPDAMKVAVVFAGCTIPPDDLATAHPYPAAGARARSGRDGVGSGWLPLAAMVPILRTSVGGDRPQFPVRESMRLRCLAPLSVLATPADDEAA